MLYLLSYNSKVTTHALGVLSSYERDKSNVISCINKIREKLPSKFTFLDLQNIAEDNQFVINMNNFTDDTSDAPTYIRIFLIYKFGDSIGKRIQFNELDFEIHGKTLSC